MKKVIGIIVVDYTTRFRSSFVNDFANMASENKEFFDTAVQERYAYEGEDGPRFEVFSLTGALITSFRSSDHMGQVDLPKIAKLYPEHDVELKMYGHVSCITISEKPKLDSVHISFLDEPRGNPLRYQEIFDNYRHVLDGFYHKEIKDVASFERDGISYMTSFLVQDQSPATTFEQKVQELKKKYCDEFSTTVKKFDGCEVVEVWV